jgi:hypothetical protein
MILLRRPGKKYGGSDIGEQRIQLDALSPSVITRASSPGRVLRRLRWRREDNSEL